MGRKICAGLSAAVLAASGTGLGCESLPGGREEQAAVIGGATGAATGAAVGDENRLLAALLGGAIGTGAGYLIGAETDWFEDEDGDDAAREAIADAQASPATADDVAAASTADLDGDGFVTIDELQAARRAMRQRGKGKKGRRGPGKRPRCQQQGGETHPEQRGPSPRGRPGPFRISGTLALSS